MENFFVSLLLLDEGALTAIFLLLIGIGGISAAYILDVRITFRRVSYLWFFVLTSAALSIAQLLWTLMPEAAEAGLIVPFILMMMSLPVLFGAGVYYGGAARSREIYGDRSRAWMAFVPLVNLWLFFRRGEALYGSPLPDTRSKFSRFILDPVLVVGALAVMGSASALDRVLQDDMSRQGQNNPALSSLLSEAQSVEDSFAREARLIRPDLPLRIDEITLLRSVEADGKTITFLYDLSPDFSFFRDGFREAIVRQQCSPDIFLSQLRRGGIVEMTYRTSDGDIAGTFRVTGSDCPR